MARCFLSNTFQVCGGVTCFFGLVENTVFLQKTTTLILVHILTVPWLRLLVTEFYGGGGAGIQFRAISCEIYGGQSGTAVGIFLNTSVFPCQWHFNHAPCLSSSTCGSYHGKRAKSGNLPRKYRKSRSVGENYSCLVLRRSTCKVLFMSEFSQNRNVWTNFSQSPNKGFQDNSCVGVALYHAGRTDGQTYMTRLLATALWNCDVCFGQKYGAVVLINKVTSVKIIIN